MFSLETPTSLVVLVAIAKCSHKIFYKITTSRKITLIIVFLIVYDIIVPLLKLVCILLIKLFKELRVLYIVLVCNYCTMVYIITILYDTKKK